MADVIKKSRNAKSRIKYATKERNFAEDQFSMANPNFSRKYMLRHFGEM